MKYSIHSEDAKIGKSATIIPHAFGAFGKIAHRCASDRYALQVSACHLSPLLVSESYI